MKNKTKTGFGIKTFVALVLGCSMLAVSCKKEGPGGKSSISGNVEHHSIPVPNSIVYIKYGEMEFPGEDVASYDASVVSDSNAHFEFKELQKGHYFLFAVGYDNSHMQDVKGGVGVMLKKNEAKTADVAVTE